MTPNHPAVEVLWVDSCSDNRGWTDEVPSLFEGKKGTQQLWRSVGLLLRRTKQEVVLALSESPWNHTDMRLMIPRACIKQIRLLRASSRRDAQRRVAPHSALSGRARSRQTKSL